jgi:hypothetical protein
MNKQNNKKHLSIAKKAREIMKLSVPVDIEAVRSSIPELEEVKTKKEAMAASAFWIAVAMSHGESIDQKEFSSRMNALKGKDTQSSIEIRTELNKAASIIQNKKIKNLLTGIDEKEMASDIADTVIQKFGSSNSITTENEKDKNGWAKFGIALILVLATKIFSAKK